MDNDLKRLLEGESGTFTVGPLTPQEFLQQIAESEMPDALFAKFCLENPHVKIGQRIEVELDHDGEL